MRIAYLSDPASNNGFYRAIGPMTALAQCRGHQVRKLATEGTPPLADVRDVDVLHIHRFVDEPVQRLAREAKAHGAAVTWDNDDDIGALPKNTPAYKNNGGVHWERRLAGMKRIFELADLVTTPSRTLAVRLQADGAGDVEIIENHVPDQFLDVVRAPHPGVIVGWVAGRSHHVDVDLVPFKAALQRVLDERPDVHVVTIGLGIGLSGERYHATPAVPLLSLPMQAAQLDIGIAPIADIDFNRARSNVKVKEYAAVGLAWLASPIGPYAGMGEQQGGRLVPDDRWYDELIRLVDKPKDRRKLAKRGAKWIAGETLTHHAATWETALARAVERARATSSG